MQLCINVAMTAQQPFDLHICKYFKLCRYDASLIIRGEGLQRAWMQARLGYESNAMFSRQTANLTGAANHITKRQL
jgi:hypothetical protein